MAKKSGPMISVGTAFIIAGLLQVIWGFVPSASNIVIAELPVELYIALRWTIAGAIIAAYLLIRSGRIAPLDKNLAPVALLGVLGYALGSMGALYGLKLGGVTNFALMGSLSPVVVSLASVLVLRERPRRLFFIALPCSAVGLFTMVIGKREIAGWSVAFSAAALILACYALEALVFVYSKRFKGKFTTLQYLAVSQLAAAAVMWILQIAVLRQAGALVHLSAKGWLAALFVSLVACVLLYAVLYWLLNFIEGHRLALFDGLHTISAALFGYLVFDEKVSWLMVMGGVLLLGGLVLGNWPWKSETLSKPA